MISPVHEVVRTTLENLPGAEPGDASLGPLFRQDVERLFYTSQIKAFVSTVHRLRDDYRWCKRMGLL